MPTYFLNSNSLKTGDIILEAGESWISKAIMLGDRLSWDEGGKYSHAFIYIGMSYIMEADEDVRSILAARIVTDDPSKFLVLRHPSYLEGIDVDWLSQYCGLGLFFTLHSESNKEYNWRGMLGTKIPFLGSSPNKFFCTQLVAEAYRRLGIEIFEDCRSPEKVTPNSLISAQCRLVPFDAKSHFERLPERDWVAELASKDRYSIMREEMVPLAQLTHEIAQRTVRLFGPRIEKSLDLAGSKVSVGSVPEILGWLFKPDLIDGNKISDSLVEYMQSNYPIEQTRQYRTFSRIAAEEIIKTSDESLISTLKATLERDIRAIPSLLELYKNQIAMLENPLYSRNMRSIHHFQLGMLKQSLSEEIEFFEWRQSFIQKL